MSHPEPDQDLRTVTPTGERLEQRIAGLEIVLLYLISDPFYSRLE